MSKKLIKLLYGDLLIDNNLLDELLSNKLYLDIIESKPFRRLSKISFLGSIDYKTKNNKRFYRYEHSISVALLGLYYTKHKNLNRKDTRYLILSALLHDIGHSPLSHSAEFGFKNVYGLNHHDNGNEIITGKHKIFKGEIKNILNRYNIDENYIIAILNKKIDNEVSFVLNNPINIDTIDGVLRSYLSFNYRKRYQKLGFVPKPTDVIKALIHKDETTLDSFWNLKHRIYSDFIHKTDNLYIDTITQEYIKKNNIPEKQFHIDDSDFFKIYRDLLQSIYNIKTTKINKELKYKKRNYYKTKFSIQNIYDTSKRYKHSKQEDVKKYVVKSNKHDNANVNLFERFHYE